MRISDWSSDVCSSDLDGGRGRRGLDDLPDQAAGVDHALALAHAVAGARVEDQALARGVEVDVQDRRQLHVQPAALGRAEQAAQARVLRGGHPPRAEENTSELQAPMSLSFAVIWLEKK